MEQSNAGSPVDLRRQCGTLVYTKAGLFTLFAYLLWGDFCFSAMEAVWPTIMPLMLKAQGTPNVLLSLVITTIPSAMNFVMNPIIGTMSDRHRGRGGRRIPFLLVATPFVTLFLILLGFSRQLGTLLHDLMAGAFPNLSAAGVSIGLLCILIVCFRFFELIVNTIFWYLFNDVVPSAFIGRFLGLFRVVGSLVGALFNFFLLRYADSHASMIFFGVAVLYGTGFMLMCLKVKEGKYPPPNPISTEKPSVSVYVRTFFKECFSHKVFRLVFAYSAAIGMSGAINTFTLFMAFSIGLTLDDIGKITGVALIVGMFLMYPMGSLVDRFHPIRIMLVSQIGFCVVVSSQLVFLFYDFPKPIAFWIYAAAAGVAIPITVANAAASLPMYMRLFPHEQFGQFCAANAMCLAVGSMIGGVLSGLFLDGMKSVFPEGDYAYRFVPVWNICFMLLALLATILAFREWKKLGGDKGYLPPKNNEGEQSKRGPSGATEP